MPNELVSILTPFKNSAKYLEECLNSIIDQSYSNWELIIVDDHSTDSGYEIVSAFSEKEKRIKLLRNRDSGIIPALRLAFQNSKGEFITRMDSDDVMVPQKLTYMVEKLKNFGPGHVAVGQVEYFSENGISDGYARYERWLNHLTASGSNYSELYKECVIPSPCWMTSRKDLIKCGAFNPDRYPEDYDLTFRFYEKNLKIIPCDEVLHMWRDYESRTSRTHEHYAQNYFLDIKLHYFIKLHLDRNRPLTVWGAGFKGKTIAQGLVEQKIPFEWICDNPKKIGKTIYGIKLKPFESLGRLENPQCIITVANEDSQIEIRKQLILWGLKNMKDYFFFC